MRIAAIGIGRAGSHVVDEIWRENETRQTPYLAEACALDTDTETLDELRSLPTDNCHSFGLAETDGTGTDGDRTAGVAAIEANKIETRRALDQYLTSAVDAIVLVAGLAGGTGGGATPYIADALRDVYQQPVYVVSILPAGDNPDAAHNALQSLRPLKSVTDGHFLFDNDHWLGAGQSIEGNADILNKTLADRLGTLYSAGEVDGADTVAQSVVDTNEITATVSESGFVALGHASQDVQMERATGDTSLLERVRNTVLGGRQPDVDKVAAFDMIETTLREAVRGKLTIKCGLETAERGLVVFRGPPEWLNREAIVEGCSWLEAELSSTEVRNGDVPVPTASTVSVLMVASGVTAVPRIGELGRLAG